MRKGEPRRRDIRFTHRRLINFKFNLENKLETVHEKESIIQERKNIMKVVEST